MAVFWLILLFIAPFFVKDEMKQADIISYLYDVAYVLILIIYTVIIVQLCAILNKRRRFFSQEYRYIFMQFIFFLTSFITKILL